MDAYASAFSRLDKAAVRKIYPTVPDRNFDGLEDFKSYEMKIEIVKIRVNPPRVEVETRTTAAFTTFSGKQERLSSVKEKMTFIESKDGAWVRVQ